MIDSANCLLCCILLFPFQQVCVTRSVLSPRSVVKYCTCCSSCFPYISKKAQQGRAAFPEKAAAKVVLCCFPCSRLVWAHRLLYVVLVVQVVFPNISKKTQQGRAAFPEKAAAKVVLCCFPCSRIVWVLRLLYVVLVVLVVFLYQQEDSARTGCFSWKSCRKSCSLLFPLQQACLSSQVVIRCTCCSSCFPYISKKTQYKVLTNRLTRD